MKKILLLSVGALALAAPAIASEEYYSSTFDNSAVIDQKGGMNQAIVDQRVDGTLNGQNAASITQDGNENMAEVRQLSLTNHVSTDFDNEATIEQLGDRGYVDVYQIHDYGSEVGLKADVFQSGEGASAVLEMRGDDNTVIVQQTAGAIDASTVIRQNGMNNIIDVAQDGSGSYITVDQGHFSASSDGGSADSSSSASVMNEVYIVSSGDDSMLDIYQIGAEQLADIMESGSDNTMSINMYGDMNTVFIDQHGSGGFIETKQYDILNWIEIEQDLTAEDDIATVTQEGTGLESYTFQADTAGLGGGNEVSVYQTGYAANYGDVVSTIHQDGSLNFAMVDQYSDFALSTIMQSGTGHFAQVNQ
jgi:hypothetical protein